MNQMNMHSMPPGAVGTGPGGMGPGMPGQGMSGPGMGGPGMGGPGMGGPGMSGPGLGGPGMAGPGMAGPGMGGPGMAGQGMQVGGGMMQQPSPQMQQVMAPQVPPEKIDNISKVKSFIGPLRESLTSTLKSAAQVLHQNHNIDAGSQKGIDPVPRFDKNLEEFYSVCDQIELHLRTSISCIQQAQSAAHYLPLSVLPSRMDPPPSTQEGSALSYPQYLSTVQAQVAYAKELHDTLVAAAQNISPTE